MLRMNKSFCFLAVLLICGLAFAPGCGNSSSSSGSSSELATATGLAVSATAVDGAVSVVDMLGQLATTGDIDSVTAPGSDTELETSGLQTLALPPRLRTQSVGATLSWSGSEQAWRVTFNVATSNSVASSVLTMDVAVTVDLDIYSQFLDASGAVISASAPPPVNGTSNVADTVRMWGSSMMDIDFYYETSSTANVLDWYYLSTIGNGSGSPLSVSGLTGSSKTINGAVSYIVQISSGTAYDGSYTYNLSFSNVVATYDTDGTLLTLSGSASMTITSGSQTCSATITFSSNGTYIVTINGLSTAGTYI